MNILEKKSRRKAKAIRLLVESQEYSIPYALLLAEEMNDDGRLLDTDFNDLVYWLEEKLEPQEEVVEEENIENV